MHAFVSHVTARNGGASYTGGMKGAVVRFPAAIEPKQPLRNSAAQLLRRVTATRPSAPIRPPEPTPLRADELPLDPDERVRLVGEW